jgi:hypothetical protein
MLPGHSQAVKQQIRGVNHPLASKAEFKERVELYPYSTSVPSRRIGRNLHLTLPSKAVPLQAWRSPESSRRLRLPDFKTIGT